MIIPDNGAIEKITPSHAECIIHARKPLRLFYLQSDGGYVGIDNTTGEAWTEEFRNLRQCKRWLLNPSLLVPSMEEVM